MKKYIKNLIFFIILFLFGCDILQDEEQDFQYEEQDFQYEYCSTDYIELWGESYNIEQTTELILDSLDGIIPLQIGCLENLKKIDFSYSTLSGAIPSEISYLFNLEELNLTGNQLVGEIPSQIGDLTNLSTLILSYNQLSGEIPLEIGNLNNLLELRLSNNFLTGGIPDEFINLQSLIVLDLKVNQLTSISSKICSLNLDFNNWGNFTILDNQVCPPYPSCLSVIDISTQNTINCP